MGTQTQNAKFSKLTWKCDVRENVLGAMQLDIFGEISAPYRVCVPDPEGRLGSNLTLEIFSSFESSIGADGESVCEKSASLHYSLSDCGMIVVVLYPHASPAGTVNENDYVIEVLKSAHALAGAAGRQRVRRHIRALFELSRVSAIHHVPDRTSSKYLGTLQKKKDKFVRMFSSPQDRLQASLAMEVALGTGLVASVIPTSFLIALEFGKDEASRAADIKNACLKAASEAKCLSSSNYQMYKDVSDHLTTPWILGVSWFLLMASLIVLYRMKHSDR
jgi:hypothetical protein